MAIVIGGPGTFAGSSGDDLIFGSASLDPTDTIYGDSTGTLAHATDLAGNDVIFGIDGFDNLRGDADKIGGASTDDFARGGDDLIVIGASGTGSNDARGDANTILGYGAGGNDVILGSAAADEIRGDAKTMQDHAHGGADWLHGGDGGDSITGDARDMTGDAAGGGDHLFGGNGDDTLRGDAKTMGDAATGGNDWLDGGRGNDVLWGDAESAAASVRGGNDVLIGGAGLDSFDFAGHSGRDVVLDFDRDETGDQLVFKDTDASAVSQSLGAHHDLVVTVAAGADFLGSVTLEGVHHLLTGTAAGTDFILA